MTATNYGNGYKFTAIMNNRKSVPVTAMIQRMTKKGWGKPFEIELQKHFTMDGFVRETAEQALARYASMNPGKQYRIAE